MTHAGRSVILSGSTVALGLLSMVALPLALIRWIGIGGMLIPAVSVLAAITLRGSRRTRRDGAGARDDPHRPVRLGGPRRLHGAQPTTHLRLREKPRPARYCRAFTRRLSRQTSPARLSRGSRPLSLGESALPSTGYAASSNVSDSPLERCSQAASARFGGDLGVPLIAR